MKLEYRIPFVSDEWKPMKAESLHEADREIAAIGPYGEEAIVRDAKTKKRLQRGNPYGRNAGTRCDTNSGPCACGAWH